MSENINYQTEFTLKISLFSSSYQSFFFREMSVREIAFRENVIRGTFRRENVRLENWPLGELSFVKLSVGELFLEEMNLGKCPSRQCLSGNCPDTGYTGYWNHYLYWLFHCCFSSKTSLKSQSFQGRKLFNDKILCGVTSVKWDLLLNIN